MGAFVRFRSTQFKLRSFFKRHAHLLVFFGALIVFFTFIIKEGLRDRWMEQASAIEREEGAYLARNEAFKTQRDLTHILVTSSKLDDFPKPFLTQWERNNQYDEFDRLSRMFHEIELTIAEADREQGSVHALLVVLPNTSYTVTTNTTVERDRKKYEEQYNKLAPAMANIINAEAEAKLNIYLSKAPITYHPELRKMKEQVVLEMKDHIEKLYEPVIKMYLDTTTIPFRIVGDADKAREHYAHNSEVAWWLSAFLFAIGWGLGLLGKLYGVPEAAGEEK